MENDEKGKGNNERGLKLKENKERRNHVLIGLVWFILSWCFQISMEIEN